MYLRAVHAEPSVLTLRQLIRENPLGILTTAIPSPLYPLLQSSHIPFLLDVDDEESETELGVLRGHLARANPQSKAMMDSLAAKTGSGAEQQQQQQQQQHQVLEHEVLVLFNSPVHHYITPKFYTETKPDTGKVVPTWNYAAAQVYGRARVYCDAGSPDTASFLSKQISDLSAYAERSIMGYTAERGSGSGSGSGIGSDSGEGRDIPPWDVADAPDRYVAFLQKAIIGIEITVDRLEGKFKMSQELTDGDRRGVVDGFEALGSDGARAMASVIRHRAELKADDRAKLSVSD